MNASSSTAELATPPADEPPLGRRGLLALVGATLALQAFAWGSLEGYPLADAVGYLDRARVFVHSGGLQPSAENLRSVAFPLLFAPLFWIAKVLEVSDERWIMPCARLIQMALATGLVLSCVRLGARLFGRSSGLAAGFLAATSPVLLIHSVSPVADVAAGLCVVRATEALLFGRSAGRLALGGAWAGLGFVISYKTLAVQLLLLVLLVVRDRWRRRGSWLALALGLAVFTALQVVVDAFVYGRPGHSVLNYLADNLIGVFATGIIRLGFLESGRAVYRWMTELRDYPLEEIHWELTELANQKDALWYVRHAYRVLVPAVLVTLPFGCLRLARERRLSGWIPLVVAVGYVALLSQKGNKSFRLLLPVLPFVVIVAGAGWPDLCALVRRSAGERAVRVVAGAGVVVALLTAVVGYRLSAPRAFGGYWQAMAWVNEHTRAERAAGRRVHVASAHYFAMFLRGEAGIAPLRCPAPVWEWRDDPAAPDAAQVNGWIVDTLDRADWLLHSETLLLRRPEYLREVQARFSVAAAFWARGEHSEKVGPVYALERRDPRAGSAERRFAELEPQGTADDAAPLEVFERVDERGRRRALELLGVTAEPLPGSGLTWLTFRWRTPTGLARDWSFETTLTTSAGRAFDLGHRPAAGIRPTSTWPAGAVVREGLLARTDGRALEARPIGTAADPPYRLRIDVVERGDPGSVRARLGAADVAELIAR